VWLSRETQRCPFLGLVSAVSWGLEVHHGFGDISYCWDRTVNSVYGNVGLNAIKCSQKRVKEVGLETSINIH
jgi:hypothetical protein